MLISLGQRGNGTCVPGTGRAHGPQEEPLRARHRQQSLSRVSRRPSAATRPLGTMQRAPQLPSGRTWQNSRPLRARPESRWADPAAHCSAGPTAHLPAGRHSPGCAPGIPEDSLTLGATQHLSRHGDDPRDREHTRPGRLGPRGTSYKGLAGPGPQPAAASPVARALVAPCPMHRAALPKPGPRTPGGTASLTHNTCTCQLPLSQH